MAYEYDTIKFSQDIFSYLLKNHEMSDKDASVLYRAYTESEEVRSLVTSQGESADVTIQRYGHVIYLIPNASNTYLGFSKADLKNKLCKANATDRDYYLVQFAIIVLLQEFYTGQGSTSKIRDFLRIGDYQNRISVLLKEGAEKKTEQEQVADGIAFAEIQRAWESLRSDDKLNRQKTTKEGFLYHILKFLEEQHLIDFIEQDEMVKTTQKLDHFMDWNLLSQSNYERVSRIVGELKNE